jgi:glyoxylase-like metal-dependent hydrolase (beta-lactamase superfamily II)
MTYKDSGPLVPGVAAQLDDYVTRVIAPNPSVMTGPGTNTYLIGSGPDTIVMDPGPDDPAHTEAIVAAAGSRRIRQILCTHTHMDHAPGASTLRKVTGAPVVGITSPKTDHDYELRFDRILADGDSVDVDGVAIRALHTPGHASNHICFLLESTGMLFTGDHIMQGSTVVIWPPDGSMRSYLESLRRLRQVDLRVLAPGHGYLIEAPHAEIDRLINHRLKRESKVRDAVRSAGGNATLKALLPLVYDDVSPALHSMAAHSLRAHLQKLVEDGELELGEGVYRPYLSRGAGGSAAKRR